MKNSHFTRIQPSTLWLCLVLMAVTAGWLSCRARHNAQAAEFWERQFISNGAQPE